MGGFGNQLALLFAIILFIASLEAAMASKETKVREDIDTSVVRIYNKLGDGLNLTIHCKSKDDDLGVHVVTDSNCYHWKFRVNFFATTLFFCGLTWSDGSGVFDIYKATRDLYRCPTMCIWEVLIDGTHGFRQFDNVSDILYKWP